MKEDWTRFRISLKLKNDTINVKYKVVRYKPRGNSMTDKKLIQANVDTPFLLYGNDDERVSVRIFLQGELNA